MESKCAFSRKQIRAGIRSNVLSEHEPREARVWHMEADACGMAALEQRPSINFFCSPKHLDKWRVDHPHIAGPEYDMEKAFRGGVAVFGHLLE